MKIFLLKDVEKVGMAGEMVNVKEGFARNVLVPRKQAIIITKKNEAFYKKHEVQVERRKEKIESQTSMLAEKIKSLKITLKRKVHDDGKLYGAIKPVEVVDLLAKKGVSVSKNQIEIPKSIKEKGTFKDSVVIKLSSRLKPKLTLNIIAE